MTNLGLYFRNALGQAQGSFFVLKGIEQIDLEKRFWVETLIYKRCLAPPACAKQKKLLVCNGLSSRRSILRIFDEISKYIKKDLRLSALSRGCSLASGCPAKYSSR
jgi:hypothetical protein